VITLVVESETERDYPDAQSDRFYGTVTVLLLGNRPRTFSFEIVFHNDGQPDILRRRYSLGVRDARGNLDFTIEGVDGEGGDEHVGSLRVLYQFVWGTVMRCVMEMKKGSFRRRIKSSISMDLKDKQNCDAVLALVRSS